MRRCLSILIFIGLAYGQINLDLLIFKGGLKYYGEFLKIKNNKIYFKPKDSKSYQSVLSYRLDRVELKTGEVLNFKELKKPKEPISEKKVIKKSELVLKKKEKFLRLYSPQKLIINNDIRGTFESITKDHLNINTGFYTRAVPISSIINISVENTVSNSFWDGALVGAGACIMPIALLSIGNSEAHFGLVFAGIATPIMAVLGGLTSVIFSKRARIKVYNINENSWTIINE